MKIEEGKFYRTRDGSKVGPARRDPNPNPYEPGRCWVVGGCHYHGDGTPFGRASGWALGLMEEWPEGPVRTVTRKEIVPGGYDGVRVDIYDDTRVRIGMQHTIMDAGYLRAAADVFTQIADALEDQK